MGTVAGEADSGSLKGGGLGLQKDVYKSEGVKIKWALSSGSRRRPEVTLGTLNHWQHCP